MTQRLQSGASVLRPRAELIQVAESVAREKGIDKADILHAIELAIHKAVESRYGQDKSIRVSIDAHTGEVLIECYRVVVDVVEVPAKEISLADAQQHDVSKKLGDEVVQTLPLGDFGRMAAMGARQIIVQYVREAERAKQYEEFKDRVGDITNVLVKRVEFGNVICEVGQGEGILKKEDMIPRETFRVGDRVRALILLLAPESQGPMVILSRTHPLFMAKLFVQEVSEIYDGAIQIKAVARDPGSRAKIAVYSSDANIDPIGSCVGMRGSRVQAVISELRGEKIDVIPWSSSLANFIVNALAPAEVSRVVLDEDAKQVEVVVAEDQLSLAIGRRGQNVRLASQLTGMNIDVVTESTDTERRSQESKGLIQMFELALDVDEMIAQLLIAEGFRSLEEIAYVDLIELTAVEGFDDSIAEELQKRALDALEKQELVLKDKARSCGAEQDLIDLVELSSQLLLKMVEQGVKTRDNLADLSGDELRDLLGSDKISLEDANRLILKAREHWF